MTLSYAIVVIALGFIKEHKFTRKAGILLFKFGHDNKIDSISYNSFEQRIRCQIEHDGRDWLSSYSIFISITYVLHTELINLGVGGTTIVVVVIVLGFIKEHKFMLKAKLSKKT